MQNEPLLGKLKLELPTVEHRQAELDLPTVNRDAGQPAVCVISWPG